ncbi:LPS-assembly protein LptD [bacterium]|nr:LPS-assembly protein LptD [bacterium]
MTAAIQRCLLSALDLYLTARRCSFVGITSIRTETLSSLTAGSSSPFSSKFLALAASILIILITLCFPSKLHAAGKGATHIKLPTEQEYLSQQFRGLHKTENNKTAPTHIEGRTLIYNSKDDSFTVYGNAKLLHGSTTLTADKIFLKHRYLGQAVGHVLIVDPAGRVTAHEINFDLRNETATMDNGQVTSLSNYHLKANRLRKLNNQEYEGTDATITTCMCNQALPDWSLTANRLLINYGGIAKAYDAYFNILGHPLIPFPFIEFDTNSERHSGFLSPRYGESSLNGFEYEQPYFFDISKSQDLTAQFDLETSTRIGGQLEYRLVNGPQDYLSVTGDYFNESIRSEANRLGDLIDPQIANPTIPIERWGVVGIMQQYLTPSLFLYGTGFTGSDSLFFREIQNVALSREYGWNSGVWQTARDAISNLGLIDEFNDSYLQLDANWNQDLIQPQQFALQTLPQLLWSGYQSLDGGLALLNYDASAVDYWRQSGYRGQRVDVNPRVTVPWTWSRYLDGWASVGADAAAYNVSGSAVSVLPVGTHGLRYNNGLVLDGPTPNGLMGRVIPTANLGLRSALVGSTNFNRFGIGKVSALIQPFVDYSYVPSITQSQFPIFDSIDRIDARSLITYGASVRVFGQSLQTLLHNALGARAQSLLGPSFINAAGATTTELFRLNVEEAFDTSHPVVVNGSHWSDLAAQASLFPTSLASGSANFDWSVTPRPSLNAATFSVAVQPPGQIGPAVYTGKALEGSYLQFSYTYAAPNATLISAEAENAINAISMQTYVGILNRLGVYFAPIYDVSTAQLLANVVGGRLKSSCDCWIIDVAVDQTYYPKNTGFTFQLTLGGLGSIGGSPFGSNPFQMLGFVPARPGLQ